MTRVVLNFSTHTDCGVFGGWPYLAYQYIQQAVNQLKITIVLL